MNIKEIAQAMHNKYGDVSEYLLQRYKSMCKENEKINSTRRAFCDKTGKPFKSTKTEVLDAWEKGGRNRELTVVQLSHGKCNNKPAGRRKRVSSKRTYKTCRLDKACKPPYSKSDRRVKRKHTKNKGIKTKSL